MVAVGIYSMCSWASGALLGINIEDLAYTTIFAHSSIKERGFRSASNRSCVHLFCGVLYGNIGSLSDPVGVGSQVRN